MTPPRLVVPVLLLLASFSSGIFVSINQEYNAPTSSGQPIIRPDCPAGANQFINQAFSDALEMALDARDVLRSSDIASDQLGLFRILFTSTVDNVRLSQASTADIYSDIGNQRFSAREVIVHCDPGWIDVLFAKQSVRGISSSERGCDSTTDAFVERISSGSWGRSVNPDYGPGGAFRSGIHVVLCPQFFDLLPASSVQPNSGVRINSMVNQGMVVLHELMHVYDRSIKDGGYGFGGCLDVTEGIFPNRFYIQRVVPEKNAETFAMFALGVTSIGGMNKWDWRTGSAKTP